MEILEKRIADTDILWIFGKILRSFSTTKEGIGLPLGNLTSQLLVNIYMNEFDQYMKHTLKTTYYIRYADDFVVLSNDKLYLQKTYRCISRFLSGHLKLQLHPTKVSLTTYASGVDFLGWVHFPDYRVLRTTSKKRMLRRVEEREGDEQTLQSYLGLLGHGNTYALQAQLGEVKSQFKTE